LFSGEIISPAQAASHEVHKIAICDESGDKCATIHGRTKKALTILSVGLN